MVLHKATYNLRRLLAGTEELVVFGFSEVDRGRRTRPNVDVDK